MSLACGWLPRTWGKYIVTEASLVYSLYTDQSFVVDKRPIYYGFVNAEFACYADEGTNPAIEEFLK